MELASTSVPSQRSLNFCETAIKHRFGCSSIPPNKEFRRMPGPGGQGTAAPTRIFMFRAETKGVEGFVQTAAIAWESPGGAFRARVKHMLRFY